MKKIIAYLVLPPQILLLLVRLFLRPKDNTAIFKVAALREHAAWNHAVEYAKAQPAVAALIRERYVSPSLHDIKSLNQMPDGTLGKEYARHMLEHGFRPDFYPRIEPDSDFNYLRQRANESHDVWHVVTGIDVDEVGELKLLAVDLVQSHWPLAGIVIGISFLVTTFKYPARIGELGDGIAEGWMLGKKIKPLMAYKWEQMWDQPLSAVRRELGIEEAS